jgi:hypothetical protein
VLSVYIISENALSSGECAASSTPEACGNVDQPATAKRPATRPELAFNLYSLIRPNGPEALDSIAATIVSRLLLVMQKSPQELIKLFSVSAIHGLWLSSVLPSSILNDKAESHAVITPADRFCSYADRHLSARPRRVGLCKCHPDHGAEVPPFLGDNI